jgi:hypothetical protein
MHLLPLIVARHNGLQRSSERELYPIVEKMFKFDSDPAHNPQPPA